MLPYNFKMSLYSVIKNSKYKKYLYSARKYYYSFMLNCMWVHKVDNNKILFNNFQGKGFACNPRAIAEKIHEMAPEKDLVWIISDEKQAETLPDYIRTVNIDTIPYFREIATSAAWVFNITPARGLIKRKNQLFIQTYHGDRTVKKVHYENVGKEETDRKYAVHDEMCDYGVVGSRAGEELFRKGLGFNGKLIKYGMPRNDCLVNINPIKCKDIKNKLGIAEDCRILLYAPTFRTGRKELDCAIDFSKLLDCLEKKTNEPWICLYRAHFHTQQINLVSDTEDRILNVSQYPDMADLLMISDFLITDYSSSAGDFCETDRPIILYIDDVGVYNRELRYDVFKSPHIIAENQEELEGFIEKMDADDFVENCRQLREYFGTYDTGKASEKVAEVILDFTKNK